MDPTRDRGARDDAAAQSEVAGALMDRVRGQLPDLQARMGV